jgi:NADPH2:quinone reductase
VPFVAMILKNIRLSFFIVYNLSADDRASAIAGIAALLAGGRLTHNIAQKLPLERIAEAHDLVERGKAIGNVIVQISRSTTQSNSTRGLLR